MKELSKLLTKYHMFHTRIQPSKGGHIVTVGTMVFGQPERVANQVVLLMTDDRVVTMSSNIVDISKLGRPEKIPFKFNRRFSNIERVVDEFFTEYVNTMRPHKNTIVGYKETRTQNLFK